jgi:hypothetical protein
MLLDSACSLSVAPLKSLSTKEEPKESSEHGRQYNFQYSVSLAGRSNAEAITPQQSAAVYVEQLVTGLTYVRRTDSLFHIYLLTFSPGDLDLKPTALFVPFGDVE